MCGFVAATQPQNTEPEVFKSALKIINHRGPDYSATLSLSHLGEFMDANIEVGATPSMVRLGHNRLSIIDLSSGGNQPIKSACGRFACIFNGEIYNYIELRSELQSIGWNFETDSDTEVLLKAFQHWGIDCISKFIGMFAFVLVDKNKQVLYAVRDYFGIKPLFFTRINGGIVLGSEIKSLLQFPGLSRKANIARCADYLRSLPHDFGDETFFEEIRQIPAAHYYIFDFSGNQIDAKQYWSPNTLTTFRSSREDAALQLRNLFIDSIKLHLRSDVPIGCALSGGIDSSAIVSTLSSISPSLKIKTFTFVSSAKRNSEEFWAEKVSHHANAEHFKIQPNESELISDLPDLINTQDEPFPTTSIYAQYRVFKEARKQGIKVMLDGQGADEIFAGYLSYGPQRLASLLYQGRPDKALILLNSLSKLPGNSLIYLITKTIEYFSPSQLTTVGRAIARKPISPKWLNSGFVNRQGLRPPPEKVARLSRAFLKDWLKLSLQKTSVPNLLRFEDRNSMAHSIESRVPFLNHKLVEFVYSLPEEFFIDQNGNTKSILRQSLKGLVPEEILARRDKIGFETPEIEWLIGARPWFNDVVNSPSVKNIPLFDHKNLLALWSEAEARSSVPNAAWRIINLIEWSKRAKVSF